LLLVLCGGHSLQLDQQIPSYVELKGSQLVLSASCELVWSTVSTVTIWGGWLGTEGGYACCFCATPDVV